MSTDEYEDKFWAEKNSAGVSIKTSVPPIIVMKAALAHAILVAACDESIACLKSAIIHQQQTEDVSKDL